MDLMMYIDDALWNNVQFHFDVINALLFPTLTKDMYTILS